MEPAAFACEGGSRVEWGLQKGEGEERDHCGGRKEGPLTLPIDFAGSGLFLPPPLPPFCSISDEWGWDFSSSADEEGWRKRDTTTPVSIVRRKKAAAQSASFPPPSFRAVVLRPKSGNPFISLSAYHVGRGPPWE